MKTNKDIYILGIETSCDETSVSVVKNGRVVLSNVISSQINIHKLYGGVVPEIASRKHTEIIKLIYFEALKEARINIDNINAIAVTYGPGLIGSLLVGLSFAKGLSISTNIPYIGINHIEGHIASNYISNKDLEPPFISLIVSGGHTNLVEVTDYNKFKIYGQTNDDACGEAYDKIARVLGFEYLQASTKEEFEAQLARFLMTGGNKSVIFECFTDPELESKACDVLEQLDPYEVQPHTPFKDLVPQRIKNVAKAVLGR